MRKEDLVAQLAQERRFAWMSKKTATDIVETLMDLMILNFVDYGDPITLRGFGTFKMYKRRAFTGRNPGTGEAIPVEEKFNITFKPSAEFLRRINHKGE